MIAVKVEDYYAAEAKERQKAAGGDRKSEQYQKSVVVNSPQPIEPELKPKKPAPKARDKAAATVGVSGQSVQRAKFVKNNAPDIAFCHLMH